MSIVTVNFEFINGENQSVEVDTSSIHDCLYMAKHPVGNFKYDGVTISRSDSTLIVKDAKATVSHRELKLNSGKIGAYEHDCRSDRVDYFQFFFFASCVDVIIV